jgi:hypothetical protein
LEIREYIKTYILNKSVFLNKMLNLNPLNIKQNK